MNETKQGLPPSEDETKNKQVHLANTGEKLDIKGVVQLERSADQFQGAKTAPEPVLHPAQQDPNKKEPAKPHIGPADQNVLRRWAGKR